jgi:hypothetical protein
VLYSTFDYEKRQQEKEEDEMLLSLDQLTGFVTEEEEKPCREEESVGFFYLWDTHEQVFDIFKTARMYLTHDYRLDPAILIELCKEKNLPLQESLDMFPFILRGYLDVLIPGTGEENGRQKDISD